MTAEPAARSPPFFHCQHGHRFRQEGCLQRRGLQARRGPAGELMPALCAFRRRGRECLAAQGLLAPPCQPLLGGGRKARPRACVSLPLCPPLRVARAQITARERPASAAESLTPRAVRPRRRPPAAPSPPPRR
eukprot:354175-Chlamydomonas_euryale.AAC.8